jgi:hypothetical protein
MLTSMWRELQCLQARASASEAWESPHCKGAQGQDANGISLTLSKAQMQEDQWKTPPTASGAA